MSHRKILFIFAVLETVVLIFTARNESYISGVLVTVAIFSFVEFLLFESLSIKKIVLFLVSVFIPIVLFLGVLDPARELFKDQKISPTNHIVGYTQFNGYPKHFDFFYFFLLMMILWIIMVVILKKFTLKQ